MHLLPDSRHHPSSQASGAKRFNTYREHLPGIREHSLSTTLKGLVSPITMKGLSLLPTVVRRHQHLPLRWASAAVTGTFHTLSSVYLRLHQTLTDSADLPPGLYSATMGPSYKIHSLSRQSNFSTLAYLPYRNLYTPTCQIQTIYTQTEINLVIT